MVWIGLLLALVTLAVYFQTGSFEFTNYDTPEYVYENAHVKNGLTRDSIQWAFSTTYLSNWHPLTWLSHMLVVELFGLEAGSHHLANVLLHLVNTLLLFLILHRMTGFVWQAAFVAMLFAIHPLHIESVAWIAGRKDLLSTLFGLLAIWSYIGYVRFPTVGKFMPVLLFFLLSLMSKPMLVTLPFVLLLLDYWPLERCRSGVKAPAGLQLSPAKSKTALVLEKIPLLGLSAASCVVTVYAQLAGGAVGSSVVYSLYARLSNALVAYVSYIRQMIWPAKLAVIYPHPGNWPAWQVMISLAVLAGVTGLTIRYVKSKPWLIVGWLWFLGTLVPVIGLVQVGTQSMADRYTYVPLIGLYIMLAWTGPDLLKRCRYQKAGLAAVSALMVLILSVVSWNQARTWQSSLTLFERALAVTQNNYVAHHNLGHYHLKVRQLAKAGEHFAEALAINPKFEPAHLNLGVVLSRQGRIEDAIRSYTRALELKPDDVVAYNNLGNAFYRQGRYQRAIFNYQQALKLDSQYGEAYNGIGAALIQRGEIERAVAFFKIAVKMDPDDTAARKNLENMLAALQKKTGSGVPSKPSD